MTEEPRTSRLFFIDNLRICLIILVVLHHAGQAYGPGGWWAFENHERTRMLGAFFTVNRSFFMSLFFMISGYFLPASYDRKGGTAFLRDRLHRFGIPLLVFFFLVFPVINYVYYLNFRGYGHIPFAEYYWNVYFGMAGKPSGWAGPDWPDRTLGHLWFVEHLLLFAVCYRLWRLLPFGRAGFAGGNDAPPRTGTIVVFALALAAVTFMVRVSHPIDRWSVVLGFIPLQFGDLPRDLSFFLIGILAYRRNWLHAMPEKTGRAWLLLGVSLAAGYYFLHLAGYRCFSAGGLDVKSFVFALWEAFLCTGLCIGLPVAFREHCNGGGRFSEHLAADTYGVYLLHVPVVVALQYTMGYADLGALGKFSLVSLSAVILTFLLADALRRLPFARSVL